MNGHEPGISYPRGRDDWMRDHPLASRLLIMLVPSLCLVPIGLVIRTSKGNVVRCRWPARGRAGCRPADRGQPHHHHDGGRHRRRCGAGLAGGGGPPTAPATASTATPPPPHHSGRPRGAADGGGHRPAAKKAPAADGPEAATAVKKAVATTAAPKPTTPPTTKAAPPPTPPATTAPTRPPRPPPRAPPANTYSTAEVETIIRSVFPADQADEAVRVATRESHLVPTVRNWCCYGLFQIYFKANKTTLAAIGITSAEQLFDPTLNAEAAYLLLPAIGLGALAVKRLHGGGD